MTTPINPNVVYGPSDLGAFNNGAHTHTFEGKNRYAMPNYGNEDRSLPMLPCAECREFAVKHLGFNADPTKVAQTVDEKDWAERFQREGTLETQMMYREAGKAFAQLAQASKAKTAAAKPRARKTAA
jgi:hypothetical protein